jgi:short-subunit dehydrogenase
MSTNVAKTAFITGATTGIGYELSKLFAEDQYNLVLVARNEAKLTERKAELEEQYGVLVIVIPKDLSKPEAPREIYDVLQKAGIEVDALVNNAGFGLLGKFAENDLQTELNMIQLNITSLTALTKLFLRDMLRRGRGKIMNVASTAGFVPGPLMAVYYATKAYVISFSRAIANEVNGAGLTVTAVCPGATETEFAERAGFGKMWMNKMNYMSAQKVARIGYKKFQKGKPLVITGFLNNLMIKAQIFFPRRFIIAIIHFLNKNR